MDYPNVKPWKVEEPNPRVPIENTSLERTFGFMEIVEEHEPLDEDVRDLLLMLGDCLPSGTRKDELGATAKQMSYIVVLARFDQYQIEEFSDVMNRVGGLDSAQASHLIDRLNEKKRRGSSR